MVGLTLRLLHRSRPTALSAGRRLRDSQSRSGRNITAPASSLCLVISAFFQQQHQYAVEAVSKRTCVQQKPFLRRNIAVSEEKLDILFSNADIAT
jgi:hypothetical protein